jgi:DNA-binding HxlR family transcriptional regulator
MNDHGSAERLDNDGNHCVADGFLKFFSQEWMSHVVLALARHGPLRFGALRRQLPPRISARVLSARLKVLEAAGYVERRDLSGRVLHVEYSLTTTGLAVDAALARSELLLSDAQAETAMSGR